MTTPSRSSISWGMPWPGPEVARAAEAAGATAFCAGEFADVNAYLTTAEMVAHTDRAMVGPGIAYAFARSPFIHGSAIRHLHRTAPGRLFLALGSGTPTMNRDWFSVDASRPASRMADLIASVRAYLDAENDERIEHHGQFYNIKADIRAPIFGKLDVPIFVGAFNEGMLRMTGRVADGVLGHGLFTDAWWSEVVIPQTVRGAESADRDPSALRRWGWVITAIDDDDPETARDDARKQIGFYLTVRTYDSLVELHGWQAAVETIRSCFRSGDIAGMIAAVTDEMVDTIALAGSTQHARRQLGLRAHVPHQAFFSPPNFLVGRRRQSAYAERSITLFT